MEECQKGRSKADGEGLGGGKMEIQEKSWMLTCSKEKRKEEACLKLMEVGRERKLVV